MTKLHVFISVFMKLKNQSKELPSSQNKEINRILSHRLVGCAAGLWRHAACLTSKFRENLAI